jgi:polar amino acid transport system permease protein
MNFFGDSLSETLTYIGAIMPSLLDGLWITLELFLLTLVMAVPLGLPLSLGSICRFPPLRWLCKLYIWVFRGTPLMLQLFFFYFFLPIAFDIRLDSFPTAVITFVLNYTAYLAEIYRGGIESIDRGQYEAAQSLGLSRTRTMFGIIIPQTVKRVLPPVANEAITLVKDTALVYVIGVGELMKASKGAVNRDSNVMAYLIAAMIYLACTFLLTVVARRLEARFSRYEASATALQPRKKHSVRNLMHGKRG